MQCKEAGTKPLSMHDLLHVSTLSLALFPMANTILRSYDHNRRFHVLGFFSFLLLIQRVGATEYKVGGSKGWTVPTESNALIYNQWAEMKRFQIGDSLLFVYQPDKDSVLQVNKEDYTNCTTETPIATFSDGNTLFKFNNQSGPYYFISGIREKCLKNEKIIVLVMADRSNKSSNSNQTSLVSPPSLPPSGSIEIIPSAAPVGEESPSPPPSGSTELIPSAAPVSEESPSPPPSGSTELSPSAAPGGDQSPSPLPPPPPPPSGASSMFVSFMGSVGAFVGSYFLLFL